jgi:hypothetical protein
MKIISKYKKSISKMEGGKVAGRGRGEILLGMAWTSYLLFLLPPQRTYYKNSNYKS